jgi:hypothetical protein
MQFNLSLAILASLAVTQAFRLPADARDGAYIVQTDESGQESALHLDTREVVNPGRRAMARANLEARDQNGVST